MAHPEFVAKQKTDENYRGHVVEEIGEVISAIGKIMRFGIDSVNPLLPPEEQETNIDWFNRELDDLQIAISNYKEKVGRP